MVAASSYQNDGRPAPPRLTAAARTPTISGVKPSRHTTVGPCLAEHPAMLPEADREPCQLFSQTCQNPSEPKRHE